MRRVERARKRLDAQGPEHGLGAADVVVVAVAEHEQVERRVAARAQQRHQHPLAGVALARVLRPGIEHQHMAAGADEDGAALADVGGEQIEAALGRQGPRRNQQGERERQRQEAGAPGQREDRQAGRRQARDLGPERRDRHRPHRAGNAGQQLQERVEPLHHDAAERPERRRQGAEQGERRHRRA